MSDYPYDSGLNEKVLSFLKAFRESDRAPSGNEALLSLVCDEMPQDLKAWLHTYAHHNKLVSLGDIWFEAGACMPLSDITESIASDELAKEGVDNLELNKAVVMGNTADGEVYYAAAWGPGAKELTLVKYCEAGYDDDGFNGLGSLSSALASLIWGLEEINDIDPALRGLIPEELLEELGE